MLCQGHSGWECREAQSGAGKHEKRWLASAMKELPNCPHIWPSHSWVTYGQGRFLYSEGTAYVTYAVPSLYSKRPCSLRMGDLGWVCTQGCWATRWELQPGGHPAAESKHATAIISNEPKGALLKPRRLWAMENACDLLKIQNSAVFTAGCGVPKQIIQIYTNLARMSQVLPAGARTSWRLICASFFGLGASSQAQPRN